MLGDPLGPFEVGDQHLAARVGQAVRQLRTRPPRVERDDHCAGGGGAPERDAPLGEVAHGDRHPIARPDAVVVDEAAGERRGRRGVGAERDAVERAGTAPGASAS